MLGELAATPSAPASACTPPAISMALRNARTCCVSVITFVILQPNTNVMQSRGAITDVNNIGTRLKALREQAHLTQGQLAAMAGVSQGTIGNIEAGARKEPRNLLAIARALGVDPEWLQTGRGKPAIALATSSVRPPALDDALAAIGAALTKDMAEAQRAELAEAMAAWVRYRGQDFYRGNVARLLSRGVKNRTGTGD